MVMGREMVDMVGVGYADNVVELSGELHPGDDEQLVAVLRGASEAPPPVVVDLSGLLRLDLEGCAALLRARRRVGHDHVVVELRCAADRPAAERLRILGLRFAEPPAVRAG